MGNHIQACFGCLVGLCGLRRGDSGAFFAAARIGAQGGSYVGIWLSKDGLGGLTRRGSWSRDQRRCHREYSIVVLLCLVCDGAGCFGVTCLHRGTSGTVGCIYIASNGFTICVGVAC